MNHPEEKQAVGRSFSAAVVGCGNIGSFTCTTVARLPGLTRLVVVDQEASYTEPNLRGQDIFARDAQTGLPKVQVMKRRLAAVRPDLDVIALHSPVEQVPRGRLRVDVILACLDSKRARMEVNELAWRLGAALIDAGVHADGHLARVSLVVPGPAGPCLECAWDDADYAALEQRLPCDASAGRAPATNAPACLGSLAASLQVLQCALLLADRTSPMAAGRELVLDAASGRLFNTKLERAGHCRFDHRSWRIRPLARSPAEMTLGQALRLGSGGRSQNGARMLAMEPGSFIRTLACGCGHRRRVLLASVRAGSRALRCAQCGQRMFPTNLDAVSRLRSDELRSGELGLPLSRIGFRPGDIFGVRAGGEETHYQFTLD